MTLTDEQYAVALRERAALATPPMALDLGETVRRGQHRRRRRRWALGTAATTGIAAVAVAGVMGVAVLDGSRGTVSPADQAPRTIGTGQVVELAPGITASNALTVTSGSDGGPWWDTGLRFDYPAPGARTLSVGFAPYDGSVGAAPFDEAPADGDGIVQGVDDPDGWARDQWGLRVLSWSTDSSPFVGGGGYQAGTPAREVAYVVAGTVPSWIPNPRVALVLPEPRPTADRATTTWLELPTIPDPSGSGRLVFAAVIQPGFAPVSLPGQPVAASPPAHVYVVAGDDSGTIVSDACGPDGRAMCDAAGIRLEHLAAMVTSLGGTMPRQ